MFPLYVCELLIIMYDRFALNDGDIGRYSLEGCNKENR